MNSNSNLARKIMVIDDHALILDGTLDLLNQHYPEANIRTAGTAREGREEIQIFQPTLAIIDLSLPETQGQTATVEVGLNLLKTLMNNHPCLNLMVQSSYV
ncbi:MAG: hypothetical protein N5P05_003192 [Chroococcopsis gigantea SAG 12.99]|nr:hypothetical protein [Chroococcopsis gigantea SAG 12.99]